MSHTWVDDGPAVLGTYVGLASEGPDRTRWQITVRGGGDVAVLGRHEAVALCVALVESLAYSVPAVQT